ncbi:hypothetical protein [Methylocella silvestris]|uniref:Uncharacterized protein n=1 Tax=Methylocella silvestris TaxID=199596 RepID=A0A2J7TCG1_METSI|nr:hypothetical protein [Methylocella silvestris]PNG24445.1 hypothetical protein CR492_18660 [Methylocella silvestris]
MHKERPDRVALSFENHNNFRRLHRGWDNGGDASRHVYNFSPPRGSLFNSLNAISLNHMPDIMGKAAWDTAVF